MELSLNLTPFCYKNKVWLVSFPERLSNTFPETGRGAGVASASVLCDSQHWFSGWKTQACRSCSPRAQDFTSHQDPPMHERKGNTHSSEPFKQAMPAQQTIPSASPNLSNPGLSFISSLAPPENRSLLLQEAIAYHTCLPRAEGNLPWCQEDALQLPDEVETAPWSNLGRSGLLQLQTSLSRDLIHWERIKLRS